MYKILALLVLVGAVHCQSGNNDDLYASLKEVFGKPTTQVPTEQLDLDATLKKIFDKPTTQVPTEQLDLDKIFGKPTTQVPTEQPNELGTSTIVTLINTDSEKSTDDLSCILNDGSIGECVVYYLCDRNNTIVADGIGVIDIRDTDGPCASYIDTCCPIPNTRRETDPIKPDSEPKREGCGWSNPEGAGLRTTGETVGETKFGEFPWIVAILRVEPVYADEPHGETLNLYVGGGSLIHPSAVLTAAHYIAFANSLKVRAGEWDTQSTKEIYPYQDRDVASVEIHKDYNKGNLFYDAVILFLAEPVDLAPNVGVACLHPAQHITPAGTRCLVSGWGKNKFGREGRYQVILKKIDVPVVDHDNCQTALQSTRLGRSFELHTSFMCAGGEKAQNTCKGDGGSPLSCPIENEKDRFLQTGIAAWGIGCGEDGTPSVYVDVASVRDWIDDTMIAKGYDIDTYNYVINGSDIRSMAELLLEPRNNSTAQVETQEEENTREDNKDFSNEKVNKSDQSDVQVNNDDKPCVNCGLVDEGDRRNYYFGNLLIGELQFLPPSRRSDAYIKLLKFVQKLKNMQK